MLKDSAETDAPAADDSKLEKDFVGDSYSDTGDGTFLLVNSSGTNGTVAMYKAASYDVKEK